MGRTGRRLLIMDGGPADRALRWFAPRVGAIDCRNPTGRKLRLTAGRFGVPQVCPARLGGPQIRPARLGGPQIRPARLGGLRLGECLKTLLPRLSFSAAQTGSGGVDTVAAQPGPIDNGIERLTIVSWVRLWQSAIARAWRG